MAIATLCYRLICLRVRGGRIRQMILGMSGYSDVAALANADCSNFLAIYDGRPHSPFPPPPSLLQEKATHT